MSASDPTLAGLEYYLEPDQYESTFRERREDIDFFLGEAASARSVLEFGAGSGRVTLPLARAGVAVTAVDLARPMLARLESRLDEEPAAIRARVTPVLGDMRSVRLGRSFDLVFGTFNVIGHLSTQDELNAFLDTAEAHLAPGGHIVFDSMVPSSDELDADPDEVFDCDPWVDPTTGELVATFERFSYDPEARLLTIRTTHVRGGRSHESAPLILRQWFPRELEELLRVRNYRSFNLSADYGPSGDLTGAEMLVVQIVP